MTDPVHFLDDETLHLFFEDALEIPCTRIRLTQLTEEQPTVYEGPGTLQLGKSFGLKCKFQVSTPGTSFEDIFTQPSDMDRWQPGQLVPMEDYFELEAVAGCGSRWTCRQVFAKARPGQDESEVTLDASYVENISEVGRTLACR